VELASQYSSIFSASNCAVDGDVRSFLTAHLLIFQLYEDLRNDAILLIRFRFEYCLKSLNFYRSLGVALSYQEVFVSLSNCR
jgi:hypothetical protein